MEKENYKLDLNRLGAIVDGFMERCEGKLQSDIVKKNDLGEFDSLLRNGLKLKEFIDNDRETQDESLKAVAGAIRKRREQVIKASDKKKP